MLLEVADKERRANVQGASANYTRKSASAKVTSERHVSTMSKGLPTLQHSKSCRCVYDGDTASEPRLRQHKMCLEDVKIPRTTTSDFATNGNSIPTQNKTFNINEELDGSVPRHEDINMNVPCDVSWSCPPICIDTTKENHQLVTVDNDSPAGIPLDRCPVIRLSLRKPRDWKWKLTTSASSPSILLPVIRLVDERGDLLFDTGEKSESNKDVDSNGNNKECSNELTLRNGYKDHENRKGRRVNESPEDGAVFGKDPEGKQKASLAKSSGEGQTPMIAETCRAEEAVGKKRTRCKNRKTQSLRTDIRAVSGQKAKSNRCVVGSRSREPSKSKAHHRILERRRKRRDSSTSSDSSPEVRRWPARWRGARGDRVLEINGQPTSSCEEATDLLRRSSDAVRLKALGSRPSSSNRKVRHDDTSGSPASSRRPRRRHQRQNVPSLNIDSGMGSNVSRHSEKGLTGRRTQSHGNLCNGNKILPPDVECILVPCSGSVGPNDRNKFCGSLPNHLDSKHGDAQTQCCNGNNNDGEHAIPNNKRNEVELRLHPLPPSSTLDPAALHDQGYGSERSPEDEQPPSLPGLPDLTNKYSFITRDATTEVSLLKGSRGLGLSVTGGVDSGEQWPGLIRIKRLFVHQPAWQSGRLCQGDVLLAANGVPLVGLTNYQALEVLRKTPNNVVLTVCRPTTDVFCLQASIEPPPPPPRRDTTHSVTQPSHQLLPLPPLQTEGPSGEFDIVLAKVNHSLGFTLRKEDESVLGHYVRALVREPALSDGRIRPGDKIVAVNDVDISPMSHEEAVMFLRQCGEMVKLRLYRDASQTPVSALSPTEEVKNFKPKPVLRKEAIDMLSDLAVKKLSPCDSSSSSYSKLRRVSEGQSSSQSSSPRRRRLTKTPSPDIHTATLDRLGQKYMLTSHAGNSDSSGDQSNTSTFTYPSMDSTRARGNASSCASTAGSGDSNGIRPQRPNFLDLCGGSTTPGTSRKQKFTFSVAATGDEEWESVAATSESDDLATNTTLGSVSQYCLTTSNSSDEFRTDCVDGNDLNCDGSLPTEPASMPPLTNLSSTSSTSTAFSYRNPAYQSAHPVCCASNNHTNIWKSSLEGAEHASDQDIPGKLIKCQAGPGSEGSRGLLKWKGIVFTPEHDDADEVESSNMTTFTDDSSSLLTVDKDNEQEEQVFMVELTRGWNSRLGFSLQGDGHHTYVSAIYADSVAAKDGRLQAGDQVLMVNDENVEHMSTAEVIDLLRKIRGTIGIMVLRKSGTNLQVS